MSTYVKDLSTLEGVQAEFDRIAALPTKGEVEIDDLKNTIPAAQYRIERFVSLANELRGIAWTADAGVKIENIVRKCRMASSVENRLRSNGLAETPDGVTISTVEQSGTYSGNALGKIWLRFPTSTTWHWIAWDNVPLAAKQAYRLARMNAAEIRAWFDAE